MKYQVLRAVGIVLLINGVVLLCCDEIKMKNKQERTLVTSWFATEEGRVIKVKEQWPFMALAGGMVAVLWAKAFEAKAGG